jgi:hypothetical protein
MNGKKIFVVIYGSDSPAHGGAEAGAWTEKEAKALLLDSMYEHASELQPQGVWSAKPYVKYLEAAQNEDEDTWDAMPEDVAKLLREDWNKISGDSSALFIQEVFLYGENPEK